MFKKNDVVSYHSSNTWCRHGIAVIHGGEDWGYAKDTYWGVGSRASDSGWLREEDLKDPKLIGNLDEFELSGYYDFEDYRDEDKFYIPIGGGGSQKWYRKGAQPDPDLIYKRLQYQIEKSESEIQSANWRHEWAVKQMNEHIAKHGIPVSGKEE